MPHSFISTEQPQNRKALVTIDSTSYPAASPTLTEPASSGQSSVIYGKGTVYPSLLKVVPFHELDNATSLGVRVIGWNRYKDTGGSLWVPTLLADVTPAYNATGGSIPAEDIDGTEMHFFSNLTVATGVPTVNLYVPGTGAAAGTPPAHFLVDTVGCEMVMLQFKSSGTSDMGALWYTI